MKHGILCITIAALAFGMFGCETEQEHAPRLKVKNTLPARISLQAVTADSTTLYFNDVDSAHVTEFQTLPLGMVNSKATIVGRTDEPTFSFVAEWNKDYCITVQEDSVLGMSLQTW